ncbi:uncharacterized protein LACBIDRAFT_302739 [Laccaria bicolor S238N-H82]|uniref:Predicted protein n=1 Tax=Laccaria bicolor (strain S238N-H82 / ATCC MYA-4686) TaxID=486041 RepID=B0DI64_LACBS|nr:uncharacterized protein LACBIDRAFT_302739 [Laccaria bicolor S238N-H82]EDR05524.1 predicted protein [Laccaria bicolor S238N-H82]|eukprot:XP_001883628.1 predicted protein [Laccaria bicolor S238N-H82]
MLEFVNELFVNAAPNTTAWCETLESFLGNWRYKLAARDSLCCRFGNAMQWYATLIDCKNLRIQDYLDQVRLSLTQPSDDNEDVEMESADDFENQSHSASPEPKQLERPSEYLRARCPLCFGGEDWSKPEEKVDIIACLDVCFKQKCCKAQVKDPKKSTRKAPAKPESPDLCEPGIKVPNSILNLCGDSFKAADDKRVKASTQYFSDTGLMALLCRHDHVLWLANMTSAGEKQHYALVLLDRLFDHLPSTARVGILYIILVVNFITAA